MQPTKRAGDNHSEVRGLGHRRFSDQAALRSLRSSTLLLILLVWMAAAFPASATVFTVRAPDLTMHAGDPLPPLIFRISEYEGTYASHFEGQPALATAATSASPPGTYPIMVTPGTFKTLDPSDQVRYIPGRLTILPEDGIGAHLTRRVFYPPHFFDGPAPYHAIDVTHNSIANLAGDCRTDNAKAFSLLLSQNGARSPATTNGGATPLYLYFPPGCYATSQPLTIDGNTWTLWGAGPQLSVIRLLPNSPAFHAGSPVQFFSPASVHGNQNFREYIYDLGFSIGPGNPDAVPFTTVQNNTGAVRNVQIWAEDSRCPYAVSLRRGYPGPMLFRNVAVYGCRAAFSSNQNEYSVTMEDITTEAQTEAAFDIGSMKISLRHWLSDNQVEAMHVYGGAASVAILDSALLGGAPDRTAIAVDKGASLYIANLTSRSYGVTEVDNSTGSAVRRTGTIAQAWSGSACSLFNSGERADSLHLAVRETPDPDDGDPATWTALGPDASRWPEQIARARSATVYLPPGIYHASGTIRVTVPDSVGHLQFYQAKFETSAPQLILTVAGSSSHALVIDGCPYGSCQIVHRGSRAVVVRDSALRSYVAEEGAGDLYVEDAILSSGPTDQVPVRFVSSQKIWARQLDLEQSAVSKLECSGCRLWVLGYKTEQASSSLVLTHGAEAEVFGFFFYQNRPPGDVPANVLIDESSLFAMGWTKVDLAGYGQRSWVSERQGGRAASLPTSDANSSQQMHAFYSFGSGRERHARHP
jgi:hypothetical protein